MADKPKKTERSAKPLKNFRLGEIKEWLTHAKDSQKHLDTLLRELRELNVELLEGLEQKQRINYFESLVGQFLQSCFPTLEKAEKIKIQLWKGSHYEIFGAWSKAFDAYQGVVDLCDSEEFTSYKAEAYLWIGHIQLMQSRLRQALQAYKQSLRLALQLKDDKAEADAEANAYGGLACYYFERGELTEAASYWERALEIAEKIKELELIAKFTTNLGVVANVLGNWEKALAYYGKSLSQVEKIGDSRGLAETYHNMGMTYADAERWAEAGACYEKSYQLAKVVGNVHTQANIKLSRVELYIAIGDFSFAEALCQQALRTYLHLEDRTGEADVYKFIGVINRGRDQWVAARSYFEKSIQISRKLKSPLFEAEARFEYGRMWKQKGNKNSAQKQFEQALGLFKKIKAKKDIEKVKRELAEL